MTFELRGYQKEAVNQTVLGFREYDRQCIVLGTGGGKTEIFIETARRFLDGNPGKAVLVLSHLSILTFQTLERFNLRRPDIRTGILQANIRPYVLSDVVISTMQSSRDEYKTEFLKKRLSKDIGLIIIDEAHFIATDSYQKILSYYPEAKVLGMTATPYRSNKLMTNYFENIPYSMSVHELIEAGYLVPPKIWQVQRDTDDLPVVMGQVVSLYKEREDGKRAIIYMRTKDDCRALRELFGLYGVKGEVIVDDTDEQRRREIIDSFSRGDTRVLISVDVLTAGFDCPHVESIFMPYGSGSVTTYLQRLGRGLRRCDEIQKRVCNVYAFGSAPTLASGFYQRASNLALNHSGEVREYPTITQTNEMNWWDELPETNEKKIFTLKVVEAMRVLEKHGYSNLAGKLDRRELPDFVTKNVLERLKDCPLPKPSKRPATEKQINYLENLTGLRDESLSSSDAKALIDMIIGPQSGPDIVQEGRFKGRHISQLPHAYRTIIMKKYPNSNIARQLTAWKSRGAL